MDEEEFVRLADNNRSLISACSDPVAGLQTVLREFDVVYALFPSPATEAGWEKVCIKGTEEAGISRTAVWCASLEDAIALSRQYGAPGEV